MKKLLAIVLMISSTIAKADIITTCDAQGCRIASVNITSTGATDPIPEASKFDKPADTQIIINNYNNNYGYDYNYDYNYDYKN